MKRFLLLALAFAPSFAQAASIQCFHTEGEGSLASFRFEMRASAGAGFLHGSAGGQEVRVYLTGVDREHNALELAVRDLPITIRLRLNDRMAKVTESNPANSAQPFVGLFSCY